MGANTSALGSGRGERIFGSAPKTCLGTKNLASVRNVRTSAMHHHVFLDGIPPHNLDLFLDDTPALSRIESDHPDDTASDPQASQSIDQRSDLYNRTMREKSSLMARKRRKSLKGPQPIPISPSGVLVHS